MTPRTRRAVAASALIIATLPLATPATARPVPPPRRCTAEVATGRVQDVWVPVGSVFAGPGVTGKLVYTADAAAEMTVEGGVSVDGAGFKVSASESRSVQITDVFEATDLRAGLLKRLRFRETTNTCSGGGKKVARLRHVRATGFVPGWTTTAIRAAPRGFPYCNRFKSDVNRANYPTKIDWEKKLTYSRTLGVELSAWSLTLKVKTSQGNTVAMSYRSTKPGWICWAGDESDRTNMNFAATLKK